MTYVELRYALPVDAAEAAASALVEAGAAGIEERDASTIERPAPGEVLLVAWLPPEDADAFAGRAAIALAELGVEEVRRRPQQRERDEDEWRDAWKQHFHARPVGRFVLVPSWERYQPRPGEVVLDLDPGRAFGTGGHASTRLCLRAIDELHAGGLRPARVLDVGCGSGVLAIAALKRWPEATGVGVDVDPDAVEVSRENAERNGVAARLRLAVPTLDHAAETHDLVLANIQPEVLVPMARRLRAQLADGGALVLAGIVDEAADEVERGFAAAGLTAPRALREDGWTALVYLPGGDLPVPPRRAEPDEPPPAARTPRESKT